MMATRTARKPTRTAGRNALLVLGMHRSGTSSLARVFSLLGASLPVNVMPANYGNEAGYWEPERVVALNDQILEFFGVAWDDPFAAKQLPPTNAFPARFTMQACQIITEEYPDSDLFVLKDPRCTLLRGFWLEVLASLHIHASQVVVARPFAEVADSLLRRDATSAASAVLLYVAYGLEAAEACEAGASVVTYRQLLDDWHGVADRIAREQGIHWPRAGVQASVEIEAFLRAPARAPRAPRLPDSLTQWARTVQDWFERAAAGGKPAAAELGAIRGELVHAMDVFAPLLVDRKRQLRELARALEAANERTQQISRGFDESQATLRQTAVERDTALSERDELARLHTDTQARHTEQQAQTGEAQVDLAQQRDAALSERDEALRIHQQTEARLRETEASYAQLASGRADLEREAAQAQADLVRQRDAAMTERDEALRIHRQTEARLHETEASYAQLASGHADLEREAAQAQADLVHQRDAAMAERDEALRVHGATEEQLHATEARYRDLEIEGAQLREARDVALRACRDTDEQLQHVQSERDALLRTYHDTDQQLHQTEARYRELDEQMALALASYEQRAAQLQSRVDALDATVSRLSDERERLAREIDAIHASRSWRATAPLRGVGRLGRRLLGREQPLPLLLSGPARNHTGNAPHPAAADIVKPEAAVPAQATPIEPQRLQRRHAGLRSFLTEEFGARTADEAVLRIDRYRLPVEADRIRSAAQNHCSEDEALYWARAIAQQATQRMDPGVEPDVSIVIPVYNQLPFTLACLDALVSHDTRYTFEILVGDDASSDATARALATPINGVSHVRHERNLGFVRNCNATAALARGRHVVLLNNDTQVLPGWLDELIGTLESNPDIGLAGSKLVFPDGRMQECGGIVWRDGSAWNFGRLDDPRRPEYCYLRDTDYVSGASIALPRTLWQALGGFDELFIPAYAEDVDLAFRIRARGLRTVVQPLSQLLHFEGTSSGTDLAQGAKAYQVENLRKLHERWHDVLQRHRDNADHPELEKERAVSRRMLFVDLVTPTPNEDAGSLVAFEMMNAFRANGFKITFIPEDNFAHMGASTRALQRIGIEAIYHPSYSSMQDFVSRRDDPFDVILLVRFKVGEAHLQRLRERWPSAKVIFSNCDLHYLRELREAELTGNAGAIAAANDTKRRETDVIARSDVNLVHSEAELDLLHQDVPGAPCVLFPLVHDPVEHCAPLSARDGLCFVGGYRHAPNADGIIWFVETIWPLVLARAPQHRLYIAGSSMTAEVKALARHPNVEVVGFVHDLDAFLARRRATIAPLRFGAGAKGKVAVSLANGVPVVSTHVGAEGMQLVPGEHALVADSAEAFAAAVLEVLGDDALWQRLSAAGLQYAADVTSRASARQRVRAILAGFGMQG
jgi:GT2 family glycosyltransferase